MLADRARQMQMKMQMQTRMRDGSERCKQIGQFETKVKVNNWWDQPVTEEMDQRDLGIYIVRSRGEDSQDRH